MSLETPIKIRMLQRKLYQKAKEEPSYRFYLLYDKMYREDILAHAYARVKSNQGAPGVDGQSFWGIESQGLEEWLSGIREDLRAKTYQPQPVLRVKIPKASSRAVGCPRSSTFTWMGPPPIGDLRRCGALLTTGWACSFGSPKTGGQKRLNVS
jgi:RNA-directed DNA polymerase